VRADVTAAAAWCEKNAAGAYKAINTGLFPKATVGKVREEVRRLKERGASPRDHHLQLLTNMERLQLADFLLAAAAVHKPKDRAAISAKVRLLLKARHTFNKSKKFGTGTVALNTGEAAFVNGTGPLSHTFFQKIFPWWLARGISIDLGVSRAQEEKRSKKMRESVVQEHFFGKYGLEAELVDAGIMDKDSKVCCAPPPVSRRAPTPPPLPPQIIADPRRLLNCGVNPRRSARRAPRIEPRRRTSSRLRLRCARRAATARRRPAP
jgi:hypothetical protein